VSEDPGMNGPNWFLYARGNPVFNVDRTGKSAESEISEVLEGFESLLNSVGGVATFTDVFSEIYKIDSFATQNSVDPTKAVMANVCIALTLPLISFLTDACLVGAAASFLTGDLLLGAILLVAAAMFVVTADLVGDILVDAGTTGAEED